MKSLERRFNQTREKQPYWRSIICFNVAVTHQKFKSATMHFWFNKLVEKDDYSQSDRKDIYTFLNKLTNMPEDSKKQGQISCLGNNFEWLE